MLDTLAGALEWAIALAVGAVAFLVLSVCLVVAFVLAFEQYLPIWVRLGFMAYGLFVLAAPALTRRRPSACWRNVVVVGWTGCVLVLPFVELACVPV